MEGKKRHFSAPWGWTLRLITAGVLLLLAFVFVYADPVWARLLILAIVFGSAAFAVRGYSVMDEELLMFFGRVGPLSVAAALTVPSKLAGTSYRYASEDVHVG